jgi:hypothetical protein
LGGKPDWITSQQSALQFKDLAWKENRSPWSTLIGAGYRDLAVASGKPTATEAYCFCDQQGGNNVATFGSLICPAKRFARSRSSSSVCWFGFGISVQITRPERPAQLARVSMKTNSEHLLDLIDYDHELVSDQCLDGFSAITSGSRRGAIAGRSKTRVKVQSQPHLSPPIPRPERILMALAFWPSRSTLWADALELLPANCDSTPGLSRLADKNP